VSRDRNQSGNWEQVSICWHPRPRCPFS